jgi:hypothetical protein
MVKNPKYVLNLNHSSFNGIRYNNTSKLNHIPKIYMTTIIYGRPFFFKGVWLVFIIWHIIIPKTIFNHPTYSLHFLCGILYMTHYLTQIPMETISNPISKQYHYQTISYRILECWICWSVCRSGYLGRSFMSSK